MNISRDYYCMISYYNAHTRARPSPHFFSSFSHSFDSFMHAYHADQSIRRFFSASCFLKLLWKVWEIFKTHQTIMHYKFLITIIMNFCEIFSLILNLKPWWLYERLDHKIFCHYSYSINSNAIAIERGYAIKVQFL